MGHPVLCIPDPMRLVRPPAGRRDVDDRHDTALRLDDSDEPTASAFPGEATALRDDVCPGAGHSGPLPTRLPVVGRQLPSAHRQSRCRSDLALHHFNTPLRWHLHGPTRFDAFL